MKQLVLAVIVLSASLFAANPAPKPGRVRAKAPKAARAKAQDPVPARAEGTLRGLVSQAERR
ncbi:MAG: hypothetical protein IJJ84_00195, partial [Kiritimatiellae bacterium]|nr:hypothetical protein [Kiritimatiellia bacterium]